MVFNFSHNKNHSLSDQKRFLKKLDTFDNKVVFINGFNASGKTMLCPIISSINDVESTIFPYEIEWIGSLLYTDNATKHGFQEFVKQYCDNTVYNQMMGRNSNFRINDISSVVNKKDFLKYFKRLFNKGDNSIPKIINDKKPILCFTTNHLSFFIEEIFEALKNRCLFIETVRDPIYMFKQLKILFKDIYNNNKKKFFTFTFNQNNQDFLFHDYYNKNEDLTNLSKIDNLNYSVVNYLEKICNFYFNLDLKNINIGEARLMLLPFENFVIKPNKWIEEILTFLDKAPDQNLKNQLKIQNVPRKVLTQGFKRKVYERYGNKIINEKELNNITYEEADANYIEEIKNYIGEKDSKAFYKLIEISKNYREWINKQDKFIF